MPLIRAQQTRKKIMWASWRRVVACGMFGYVFDIDTWQWMNRDNFGKNRSQLPICASFWFIICKTSYLAGKFPQQFQKSPLAVKHHVRCYIISKHNWYTRHDLRNNIHEAGSNVGLMHSSESLVMKLKCPPYLHIIRFIVQCIELHVLWHVESTTWFYELWTTWTYRWQ